MTDIEIRRLEIFAKHGVFKEEQTLGQRFYLNIYLKSDINYNKAINLEDTVNYGELSHFAKEIFESERYDLIENVSDNLCKKIMDKYKSIKYCRVEVEKPWAPIGLALDTVVVSSERTLKRVFLGLGSNLGDKKANIDLALEKLSAKISNIKTASYIETKPWGGVDQDDFLNSACYGYTYLSKEELLDFVKRVEEEIGRVKTVKWGPRLIDIDILFYDNEIFYSDKLIIPHPYIREREFVLKPLNELAPNFIHPVYRLPIRELLLNLKNKKSYD